MNTNRKATLFEASLEETQKRWMNELREKYRKDDDLDEDTSAMIAYYGLGDFEADWDYEESRYLQITLVHIPECESEWLMRTNNPNIVRVWLEAGAKEEEIRFIDEAWEIRGFKHLFLVNFLNCREGYDIGVSKLANLYTAEKVTPARLVEIRRNITQVII